MRRRPLRELLVHATSLPLQRSCTRWRLARLGCDSVVEPALRRTGRVMTTPRDFSELPEPVRLEDTVTELDADPVPDPHAGLNTAILDATRDGG